MDESVRRRLPTDPVAPLVAEPPKAWDAPTGYCECDTPACKGRINIDGMLCCQTAVLHPKSR